MNLEFFVFKIYRSSNFRPQICIWSFLLFLFEKFGEKTFKIRPYHSSKALSFNLDKKFQIIKIWGVELVIYFRKYLMKRGIMRSKLVPKSKPKFSIWIKYSEIPNFETLPMIWSYFLENFDEGKLCKDLNMVKQGCNFNASLETWSSKCESANALQWDHQKVRKITNQKIVRNYPKGDKSFLFGLLCVKSSRISEDELWCWRWCFCWNFVGVRQHRN